MTNWRTLCEELVEALEIQLDELRFDNRLCNRARAALAQLEPEVVDDDGPDVDAILSLAAIIREVDGNHSLGAAALAEAILSHPGSRWGRPALAPAGEVGELVAKLRRLAPHNPLGTADPTITRAADLLERQAVPVPVASDTRYEFSVFDEDFTEQAAGSAPTYAQALSEGQHYLAQYQQDGPHTLEVRRVENLNPDAFPVLDDAPLPVLPEDAQPIEPATGAPGTRQGHHDPTSVLSGVGGPAMTTPNRPPLWEVMYQGFWKCPRENWRLSSAYMIRAVADWLIPDDPIPDVVMQSDLDAFSIYMAFNCMRMHLRQQLLAEADRAERGEVEP